MTIAHIPGAVLVDYDRSIASILTSGGYDNWVVSRAVTDVHFPANKDESGKKEVQCHLYSFPTYARSEQIIASMEADSNRPATPRELLVFGEANPGLRRRFRIIALGTTWVDGTNSPCVVCIMMYGAESVIDLEWYECGFPDGDRFLAVSK